MFQRKGLEVALQHVAGQRGNGVALCQQPATRHSRVLEVHAVGPPAHSTTTGAPCEILLKLQMAFVASAFSGIQKQTCCSSIDSHYCL